MQPQDRTGKEISIGDIVSVRFEVTNFVSDSDTRNLLVRHFDPQTGLPDDYRMSVDSRTVEVLSGLVAADPLPEDPQPAPTPDQAPITASQ